MLDLNTLNIAGNFAYDRMENLNVPANIKDACTKKYIHSNKQNLEIFDLKPEELLDKSILDFDNIMNAYWGKQYARIIDEMDNRVILQQQPIIDVLRTILSRSGFVRVQRIVKLPLISNKKTLGVFTFCHNIKLDIKSLYKEYRILYNNADAIKKFLEHVKLTKYFVELPTNAELKVAIEKSKHPRNKDLSTRLFVSPKTIEAHLSNLKNKLNSIDLFELLSIMQTFENNNF